MTYTVVLRAEPEGGYTVLVPALPPIVSYGSTMDEARAMAVDAIEGLLASRAARGEPIPEETPDNPPTVPVEEATGPLTIIRVEVAVEGVAIA